MSISSIGGVYSPVSKPQAKPEQETTGLEKEVEMIRKKLQSIKADIKRYNADRAKGGKGVDEIIQKLQQDYQKFSAELRTKEARLSEIKQSKNKVVEKSDTASQNGNVKSIAKQEEQKRNKPLLADRLNIIDIYA